MPRAVHVSGVCVVVSNSDSSHVARGVLLNMEWSAVDVACVV